MLISRAAVIAILVAAAVQASDTRADTWRIVPSLSASESYSDNLNLSGADQARRGWYSDISPALRVDLNGARARGYVDFRYHDLRYPGEPQFDNAQKTLYSRLTLEAIERWLYLDARAETTQQNRSPFAAAVTPDQPTLNGNRIETSTLQVAPLIRGRLLGETNYVVRYNASYVRTDDAVLTETRSGEFSARLQSANPNRRVNWALEATGLSIRNDLIDPQRDSHVRATFIVQVAPSLQMSVSEGYERTDFGNFQTESLSTPGVGATWTPSERTRVVAFAERRFFGTGHNVEFSHRTPQTAWRFTSVKDGAVLPSGVGTIDGSGSLASLMSFLLVSAIPDPAAREAAARQRLEQFDIPQNSILSSGVVDFRPYVYRNSTASVALLGARHALTFTYLDREQRYSSPLAGSVAGAFSDFRERGYGANASRRLTPLTTVSVFARSRRTDGLSDIAPDTRQRDFGASVSSVLGRHATLVVGVRRASFDTTLPVGSYRENAAFLTLNFRT
jgi:uncharacterized protein (PEP-CTERM system associated)